MHPSFKTAKDIKITLILHIVPFWKLDKSKDAWNHIVLGNLEVYQQLTTLQKM